MPKWNFVAMGQVGLTGWTRVAAKPLAQAVARRTGRPEAQILSLIGGGVPGDRIDRLPPRGSMP